MPDGRSVSQRLFADRRIGTKIGAGFVIVLAILAISSIAAWLAFGRVGETVADYAGLVESSAIFRDIDKTVAQYRGHVREYIYSDNEAAADTAIKEGGAVRELITGGLARVTNPVRHGLLESMAKELETYAVNFAHARDLNVQQAKLETDVMDVAGQQMTNGFSLIAAAANKAGNMDLLLQAADARRLSLVARLDANKRLGRHDEAAARSANQSLDELRHTLQLLDAATTGSDLNATVAAEVKLADSYQSAFQHAAALDVEQVSLVNGVMREAGDALEVNANKAKDGNLADQAVLEKETLATTANGSELVMLCGVIALAIGAALAWLTGRGISRPVVGMCAAMRALAGGEKAVEIPGVGRKDEIGQMADTVAVFKHSMIEADRLREETERHKAEAEAERKSGMLRLADTFEAGIKGVVNSVASQAAEIRQGNRCGTALSCSSRPPCPTPCPPPGWQRCARRGAVKNLADTILHR
jgi:HAMP domain-containing protein